MSKICAWDANCHLNECLYEVLKILISRVKNLIRHIVIIVNRMSKKMPDIQTHSHASHHSVLIKDKQKQLIVLV